jgi:predicted nucleic acid-binding protein
MIILDTNVISALMRSDRESVIVPWLDRQAAESLWITTVTLFESQFGIALVPEGRRRKALANAFDALVDGVIENRILDFDADAARSAATMAAERSRTGRSVDVRDNWIAGIALSRRAVIATRNVRHFQDMGVALVNPWETKAPGNK